MQRFVTYYRVSTKKQSLGLDAQKNTTSEFIANRGGEEIASFEEKISGKIDTRPKLTEAIELCKQTGATLLIAKLDRLSRSVKFLFEIKDSGIKIACCDLPELNTLTLGIFATMAQYERELISTRTKEGLKIAKQKGKVIGREKGYRRADHVTDAVKKANFERGKRANSEVLGVIKHLRDQCISFCKIAKDLNSMGFTTSRGKQFQAVQVQRLLQYL